jgi:uncharacterized phage-associated protein
LGGAGEGRTMASPISALSVGRYFLSIPREESGDLISNLKLQKLLYYSQGCWVAINGAHSPLFHDKIFAWKHGPVVRTVYNHYAKYKSDALPQEPRPPLRAEARPFLDEIYRVFGKFSAWKLREMTHQEAPWAKNYKPDVLNIEIPLSDLESYFSKHVKKA